MTSLEELQEGVLNNARRFIEPRDADRDRVFAKLTVHLGLPVAGAASTIAPLDRSLTARVRRVLATRKAVAVTFAVLGGAAGYGAGYLSFRHAPALDPTALPRALASSSAPTPQARDIATGQSAKAPDAEQTSNERDIATEAAEMPPETHRSTASSTTQRLERRETEAATTDPLGNEVALLSRAERAIRAKNPLLALGLLRELDQRYPKGKLLDERGAARVLAQCLQLAPDAARRAGEAYLRTAKSPLYHERVRQLCGSVPPASPTENAPKQKDSGTSGD